MNFDPKKFVEELRKPVEWTTSREHRLFNRIAFAAEAATVPDAETPPELRGECSKCGEFCGHGHVCKTPATYVEKYPGVRLWKDRKGDIRAYPHGLLFVGGHGWCKTGVHESDEDATMFHPEQRDLILDAHPLPAENTGAEDRKADGNVGPSAPTSRRVEDWPGNARVGDRFEYNYGNDNWEERIVQEYKGELRCDLGVSMGTYNCKVNLDSIRNIRLAPDPVPTIRELAAKHNIPLPSKAEQQARIDQLTGVDTPPASPTPSKSAALARVREMCEDWLGNVDWWTKWHAGSTEGFGTIMARAVLSALDLPDDPPNGMNLVEANLRLVERVEQREKRISELETRLAFATKSYQEMHAHAGELEKSLVSKPTRSARDVAIEAAARTCCESRWNSLTEHWVKLEQTLEMPDQPTTQPVEKPLSGDHK